MSSLATCPSSWATTERSSGRSASLEQVVVEDDPLARADPVDVGVERGRPGGWRRRGRPRRSRPRPRGRARARPRGRGCRAGSGSNSLKIGASTTGAIQVKTIASPVTTTAPPAATSARGKRRTRAISSSAPPAVSSAVIAGRPGDVPQPRAERLGREADVDGALVRDQRERQGRDRERDRDRRARRGAHPGPAARRGARAGAVAARRAAERERDQHGGLDREAADHQPALRRRGSRRARSSSAALK